MKRPPRNPPGCIDREAASDPTVWLDQHGDGLFRYALLHVQNRELCEDLVQETFLAALRARERFSGRSSERTWLLGILRHKIIDSIRQARRARSTDLAEYPLSEFFSSKGHWKATLGKWPADPANVLEQKEFWEAFDACASKLPRSLADVFFLREQEMTTEEVCKVLDISTSNLAVRLHRARLFLRRCLERNWFAQKD